MRRAAAHLGLAIDGVARQVRPSDFHEFDVIVAMDRRNHRDLLDMAPPETHQRILMFRSFDPAATDPDVPDPYYGGEQGFVDVVRMVRSAADGLIASLEAQ
jgi:protein-tyrosine phosphatase